MVRRSGQSRPIRFGREQIKTAINLEGIGADDLGADAMRDLGGNLRLSDCRRPNHKEDALHDSNCRAFL